MSVEVGYPGYYSTQLEIVGTVEAAKEKQPDAVLLIHNDLAALPDTVKEWRAELQEAGQFDEQVGKAVVFLPAKSAFGRLVSSPTGKISRDIDDSRRVKDAAFKGAQRANSAGAKKVVVYVSPEVVARFPKAQEVAIMACMEANYRLLQEREHKAPESRSLVGVVEGATAEEATSLLRALESGRIVARDMMGGDPVRMAPPRAVELTKQALQAGKVDIEVVSDPAVLEREYPLFWAVGRGSMENKAQHPQVIHLSYTGEGEAQRTLFLVGKGVTMDTGGMDIKVGGSMKGMCRDKGGASAVLGIFRALEILQPKGIKVHGSLAMVRNDVGPSAYTCDETILCRGGLRVHIGNTDAEGRMAMADLLTRHREMAAEAAVPQPHLFTLATLTGHAVRYAGTGYTCIIDNGPAKCSKFAQQAQAKGDLWAEPYEISTLRREDYDFIAPKTGDYDVLQSNQGASTMTARGHQFPMAFLSTCAGLPNHCIDSDRPIPYTHLDMAPAGGNWPDMPTGAPLVGLLSTLLDL